METQGSHRADSPEDLVARELARLRDLAGANENLVFRGRFLTTECLIGTFSRDVYLSIANGRVQHVIPGPKLMRPWAFAYHAAPEAWLEFWRPMPRPGSHDLFALTKTGAARLEGNLHPFLANLQYFKDLLALPRRCVAEGRQ